MRLKPPDTFRTKDLDLITYLRFKSFKPLSNPIEDTSGVRWAVFKRTQELEREVISFFSGNHEASLLNEFRESRRYLLDTPTIREREGEYDNGTF